LVKDVPYDLFINLNHVRITIVESFRNRTNPICFLPLSYLYGGNTSHIVSEYIPVLFGNVFLKTNTRISNKICYPIHGIGTKHNGQPNIISKSNYIPQFENNNRIAFENKGYCKYNNNNIIIISNSATIIRENNDNVKSSY